MKRYVLALTCIICITFFATACRENVLRGEGNKSSSVPDVTGFNSVRIEISLKAIVNMQEGAQPSVKFDGYENILKHIKTKVENNKLIIYSDLDDTWTMDSEDITATITMPSITALTLAGAPDAEVHGNITGTDFKLDISGASNVKLDNVNVDNFGVEVSGAGDITVKGGAVKHAVYEINGAGTLKAYPLQANETEATISGAGTSQVTALQKLTANINGAGTIKYKGHPEVVKEVSGVGTISDAN